MRDEEVTSSSTLHPSEKTTDTHRRHAVFLADGLRHEAVERLELLLGELRVEAARGELGAALVPKVQAADTKNIGQGYYTLVRVRIQIQTDTSRHVATAWRRSGPKGTGCRHDKRILADMWRQLGAALVPKVQADRRDKHWIHWIRTGALSNILSFAFVFKYKCSKRFTFGFDQKGAVHKSKKTFERDAVTNSKN